MKSQFFKNFSLAIVLIFLATVMTEVNAKKPAKLPKDVDPVYTASDSYLLSESNDSSGAHRDQIVFRQTKMNLSDLTEGEVFFDSGLACIPAPISGQGIMVLQPKSRKSPTIATLTYWFESELESMDVVTYHLVMEGLFDELENWPPTETDPETTLSFNYWKLQAENKWAQRQDCAGEVFDSSYPWTITVELQLPQ